MKQILVIFLMVTLLSLPAVAKISKSFQGVSYTILKKSKIKSTKLNINIKLEKKVSKKFLQKFALKLRQDESIKYDRIFIFYLLPNMTSSADIWATSHFNPKLKVKILGTTIEEENVLVNKPKKSSGKIIGQWIDRRPYVGAKVTLLKKNDKTIMIWKYKDGSVSKKEMIQRNHSGKLRFEEKKGNDLGEYYLIQKDGQLAIYDNSGFGFNIQPIE